MMLSTKPMNTGKGVKGNTLVLQALSVAGPQSITEIAARTKLTKSSVRDVLERLAGEGRVHKTKEIRVSVHGRAHVFALGQGDACDEPDEPMLAVRERTKAIQETNKTEQAYADYLGQLQAVGGILWHKFEGMKFRLADNTFYTPDFAVMAPDGQIELHEVKGFWQDDARAKIKIAADMYPFKFIAVKARAKRDGGGWQVEEF